MLCENLRPREDRAIRNKRTTRARKGGATGSGGMREEERRGEECCSLLSAPFARETRVVIS